MLLALATLPFGCSAVLSFNQCTTDADCQKLVPDGVAYCSMEHICSTDVPADRLCMVDSVSSSNPAAVTIGGLFRLSGADGQKDTDLANAARLAVSDVNKNSPRPLRFVVCDTKGDATQARRALVQAVEKFGAVGFVGPSSSSEVVGLVNGGENLLTKYNVIVVSGSATSPSITSLADVPSGAGFGLVWRTCASDLLQGKELATLIDPTATHVTSAYVDSTYGTGLNSAFSAALGAQFAPGPAPATVSSSFPEGTMGSAVVSYLLANPVPQYALLIADADVPSWLEALDSGGTSLSKTQYLFTDGAKAQSLLDTSASTALLARVRGTGPANPDTPAGQDFKTRYRGQFGVDATNIAFTSNNYDAVFAMAVAMGALLPGSAVTGSFIADGMSRLSDPTGTSIDVGPNGFLSAYGMLAMGHSVNLQGASGPIDFDPVTGDVLTAPIEVWTIDTTTSPQQFQTVKIDTP
ncbi:MAG: ABC transporter substrate-binding protein [Polyangia bacterium]